MKRRTLILSGLGATAALVVGWGVMPPRSRLGHADTLPVVDGQAVRSCVAPLSSVVGKPIRTIEALGTAGKPHALQAAWVAHQVPQCGYCQSGMLMAAAALLAKNPNPNDADIDAAITNICRCGTYPRIRDAIKTAAIALRAKA